MRIHLIAAGNRVPAWITQGYREFARRMPSECSLELVEIPLVRRGKGADLVRILRREGERMMAAIPKGAYVIALDVTGQQWSSAQLAQQLSIWQRNGRDVALLIGGPEGLHECCRERAVFSWSLTRLTLPHLLVRIIVAEQLYRGWSILSNHPYHRG